MITSSPFLRRCSYVAIALAPFVVSAQTSDYTREHEFTKNCEGPSVAADGTVYAVNYIMDGTIAEIPKRNKANIFLTLPKGSTGNGIRFGSKDVFYVADFTGHNVLKVNLTTKQVTTHCNEP
ncbi:MAG: hypothetical protein ACK41O_09020, partial [Runella zeae]